MALQSLLFTGHMIDLLKREVPRFPSTLESAVRRQIGQSIDKVCHSGLIGLSSCARGGDILFQEVCRERGIETCLVLPFAPEKFVETSVVGVPSGHWEKRFWTLWNETPIKNREDMNLPVDSKAYALCNLRLVEMAQVCGAFHLIAVWNGKGGDGHGGTEHMVATARNASDTPSIINPETLNP